MARTLIYERGVHSIVADNALYEKLNSLENEVKIKEEPPDPDSEYMNNETTSPPEEDVSYTCDEKAKPTMTTSSSLNNKENECVSKLKKNVRKKKRRGDGYTRRKRTKRILSKMEFTGDPVHSEDRQSKSMVQNSNQSAKPMKEDDKLDKTIEKPHRFNLPKRNEMPRQNKKWQAEQEMLLECDVCFLPMKSIGQLQRHQLFRSPGILYTCNKCKTTFADKRTFTYHVGGCNGKSHISDLSCHFCKKRFRTKSILQAHLFHVHSNQIFQPDPVKVSPKSPKCSIESVLPKSRGSKASKSRSSLPEKPSNIHSVSTKSPSGQVNKNESSPQTSNISNSDTPDASTNEIVSTPVKKMRQTTLMEFLTLSSKKVESLPVQKNEATGAEYIKSPGNSRACSNKCPRPFVQIHTNTAVMMELLNSSKNVKREPLDEEVQSIMTRQNTPYSLRQTRAAVYTPDTFNYLDTSMKRKRKYSETEQVLDESETGRLRRVRRQTRITDSKLKAMFGIKECYVQLVRYDSINKMMESVSREERIFKAPQDIGSSTTPLKKPREPVLLQLNRPSIESNQDVKLEHELEGSSPEFYSKPYQCKICKKRFSSKKNLSEHNELFHIAYISSICNARYTSKYKLLHHYLRQHTIFKRTVCCVCRESFSSRSLLQRHLLIHCLRVLRAKHDRFPVDVIMKCNAFQKKHLCAKCGKRFWLFSCLMQHEHMCSSRPRDRQQNVSSIEQSPITLPNSEEHQVNDKLLPENLSPVKCSPTKSVPKESTICKEVPSIPTPTELQIPKESSNEVSAKPTSPTVEQHELSKSAKISHEIQNKSAQSEAENVILTPGNTTSSVTPNATNEIVECPVCNIKFTSIAKLNNHTRTYGGELNHQCNVCSLALPNKRLLDQHINMAHTQNPLGKHRNNCKFCNQAFNSADHRQIHEKHFHPSQIIVVPEQTWLNEEQVWNINTACNTCNVVFESYDRFVEHNMYYYKAQSFTCTFCGETFHGLYMLHHHSKLVHYPKATRNSYAYTCDTCKEGFNQESHFHAHKLHVHSIKSPQLSNTSSQEHTTGSSIQITSVPTIEARQVAFAIYACSICQMFFTNEADLIAHETEYSLNGDFLCNGCDKRCRTLPLLKQHYCLNHIGPAVPNAYKCKQCMEVFIAAAALACHEKHVHPAESSQRYDLIAALEQNVDQAIDAKKRERINPVNVEKPDSESLKCVICDMVFEKEIDLREHLFANSNIGEYSCAVCHRKFAEMERLDQHKMKHSRINTILAEHHCPICQEGLTSTTDVKVHMLHFHGYESFQNILAKRGCLSTKLPSDNVSNNVGKDIQVPTPKVISGDTVNNKVSAPAENPSNTATASTSSTTVENNSNVFKEAKLNKHIVEKAAPVVIPDTSAEPENDCFIVEVPVDTNVQNSFDKPISKSVITCNPSAKNIQPQQKKKVVVIDPQGQSISKFLKDLLTLNDESSSDEEYRCAECNIRSSSRRSIVLHIIKYINRGNYVCDICPRRFPCDAFYQEHCRKHQRIDEGSTEYRFTCQYCNECFRTATADRAHMRHLHKDKDLVNTTNNNQRAAINLTNQPKQRKVKPIETIADDRTSTMPQPQRPKAPLQSESTAHIPELDSSEAVEGVQTEKTPNLNKEAKTDAGSATAAKAIPTASEKIVPSSRLGFSCYTCSMSFDNFLTYHSHCRIVHPHLLFFVDYISPTSNEVSANNTSSNDCKCSICNIPFDNVASLNTHMKVHTPAVASNTISSTENGSEDLKIVWEKKPEPKLYEDFRLVLQKNLAANLGVVEKPDTAEIVPRLKVKPFAKIIETLTIENQAEPPNINTQIPQSAQPIVTEASSSHSE